MNYDVFHSAQCYNFTIYLITFTNQLSCCSLSKAREVSSLFEATINETVTVDCKEQVSSSAAPSFIKRLNVAVKKKNLSEVERLWDELQ